MSDPINAKPKMLCPRCAVTLTLGERQGIEIDYCPQCRGVWLDSGELDKLIERNLGTVAPATPRAAEGTFTASPWLMPGAHPVEHGSGFDPRSDGYDDHYRDARHGRRRSWIERLFD
jgi:Zn-finger nucleic acid-binding protein